MGFLSNTQKTAFTTAIRTDETTAELWRNPPASGGRTGARQLEIKALPIRVRPAGQDDSNFKLIPLTNPLNAARVANVGRVAVDADIRYSDELRIDGVRYLVEGTGTFSNAQLIALSEIKGSG